MPLASHIQLPERYRVTRRIASGGMASVWEVEDLLLARVVAVKVLGAQYAADAGARARFAREARTAARVADHPHIATIYDIGEHGEDAFIVMEYFSGATVADQLRTAADAGRRVSRESALRWLREAASGLDHAHAAGIVHRDVKPANLLLDGRQRLAVADFGIARLADDTQMTQTGQLLGTAAYLSPEQALGRPAAAASDRYAFAVVAFELLTGARPYEGGPPTAQLRQHAEAEPLRASEAAADLPPAIDRVFAAGLAKDPGERPSSACELVERLADALTPAEQTEPTRRLTPVAPAAPAAARAEPTVARGRPREAPPAPPPGAPPHRPRPAAAPADDDPPRARRGIPPLAAVGLVAAIVGVVLALALSGGDGDPGQTASTTPRSAQGSGERTQTSAPAAPADEAQEPAQSQQTPTPAAAEGDPAKLNDRGFALNQNGSYAEAVPLLQASVEGYRSAGRTKELGYAYALYNLGVALNRSGNPAAAVEVLEERLDYPNQRGTVQQELRDAQSKLGGERGGEKKDKKEKDD
ncbi:MAG: serine/threonine-protein kinase [Thermoleophilia bacterium]